MKKAVEVLSIMVVAVVWGQAVPTSTPHPSPLTSLAVAQAEFAKYHKAVTGKAPPSDAVVFKVDPSVSKSGHDAYAIVSQGAGVKITGSNVRSVLYGVYDLLERRAGCHWFWDGDVVPKKDSIDLSGLDIHEEAHFEYRGLRYFAHRGLTRFQAEHWGIEDWKKEIDWMLKRRLNVFMLRIGQDDLFQRTFPDVCAYPDPSKPLPGAGKGYDNRSLFWSLQFRGELRQRIQSYAFERGLMAPEDFGTMTHWYSRTPEDFLEKRNPPFLPQATSGYAEKNGLVWDIRDEKWADEYWKLTKAAVDAYGRGAPQRLLHTIGLGERRCYTNRQDNFNLKIEALDKFLARAHRDYPDAKVLLAGWDFYFTWHPDEVKALVGRLDPKHDIIWDYEGDATRDWRKEMQGLNNNFTKWGVVGKFPYTYSIFLAYESALDARANYPLIEERQRIVQNDPACAGYIFWPEASHTDTLCLRYFTANAWAKEAVPHGKVLDEFCASRYGTLAGRMKSIWEKVLPASMLRDWDANYGRLLTKRGGSLPPHDDKAITTWKRPVEDAQTVFGELADIPWSDEFLRRDTIDVARMVLDRVITLRTFELSRDIAAWRNGMDAQANALPEKAKNLAALCDMMADLLELHTDYSLWESFLRLDAVEKVRNADFPKTLFDNASCGYCRSHQYELARHWYAPRMKKMASRLADAISSGNRKAMLFDDPEMERLALMVRPLDSLKPMQPRPWERYREILRAIAAVASGAASVEVRLPGEGGRHAAATCAPFPDALSAFVWRNWPVVDVDRMAKTIGADKAALEAIAGEMSLPVPQPPVSPYWRRKGYITVVKRNWHLLPYSQLLTMVDMTRAELAYSLVEDDFLFSKLGNEKPFCEPVACTADAASKGRARRLEIAKALKDEGIVPMAPEEPRFRFVEELSALSDATGRTKTMSGAAKRDASGGSSFDLRLIFSYFADYGDPLGDDEIGSYPEGLLCRLSENGVNAVWLHTVLSTLAKDPAYPEFGEGCERRIANLRKLVARAAKYGIKVYLYVNEPRAQDDAFFEKPGRMEMRGAKRKADGLGYARCTSHPETRRWLRDSLRQVFSQVQGLGGVFTITMSENLTNCASRWKRETCPRCKDRKVGDIIVEVNRTIWEGVKAGDPAAEVIAWDWGWPKDEREYIVSQLPEKSCRIMAVSEIGVPTDRGGVKSEINEYSISAPGPSERAKAIWGVAKAHGMKTAAKVQAALTWEMSAVPYVPVMDIVAEHACNLMDSGVDGVMLSWSLGSAPTPNLAIYADCRRGEGLDPVLNRLAERLYGKDGVARARTAWTAYSDGFREYPFHISSVYCGNHTLGPANPLYPEPSGWTASMVGYPFDDLKRWRSIYPEDTWLGQMEKVRDGFEKGNAAFEALVSSLSGERQAAARRELGLFRAIENHFRSVVDQGRFVMARTKGDKAEMAVCARRELETARRHLSLVRADSRIGYECSNHYFYIPHDIIEKILNCRHVIAGLSQTAKGN